MPTITITDNRLTPFHQQNAGFDILSADLSNQTYISQLNWTGLDQPTVLNQLKQYQRLLRLNPDPAVAQALLGATSSQTSQSQPPALNSALGIAALPVAQFVQKYGSIVGGESAARQMHQKATTITAQTMHLWATVQNQVASPYAQAMRVNNVSASLAEFANLPGYQDLFGSLNYCECDECASIFGPAAYFVDLMRVIDQYITTVPENNIPSDLTLDGRRADLAQIDLTCANTNNLVPYLDIITGVLVQKAAAILKINPPPPDPSQPDPLANLTYQALASQTYPFNLPFNLPLEQVRRYLGQLNTDLATIYSTFYTSNVAIARETLGLSLEEYALITTATPSAAALSIVYGLPSGSDPTSLLSNAETFLQQTGLTGQALQDLFTQNLLPAELNTSSLPHALFINQLVNGQQYLQLSSDGATISNLTLPTLDRLNRFLRLAGKLNWSYADLDWVLRSLLVKDIDADAILKLAQVKQLQTRLKLPLDVLCSLWYDIKTIGVGTAARSQALFDILFNAPGQISAYHPTFNAPGQMSAYHPTYTDSQGNNLNPLYTDVPLPLSTASTRVAAGLRCSLDNVALLAATLLPKTVTLTVQNLSMLYRHALCATILKQPIDAYFSLLGLTHPNWTPDSPLLAADLLALLDVADWLTTSRFTVYELMYILNGVQSKTVVAKYQEASIEPFLFSLEAISSSTDEPQGAAEPEEDEQQEQLLQSLATFMQSDPASIGALMLWITNGLGFPATDMQNYTQVFLSQEYEAGLVGYWPMYEGSGTLIEEKVSGNNGMVIGTPLGTSNWLVVEDFPMTAQRPALQFATGTNIKGIYAQLPPTSLPAGNAITVSFWTRGPITPTVASILVATTSDATNVFTIQVPWGSPGDYFPVNFQCGGQDSCTYKIASNDWSTTYAGKWVYWTFTKDATLGVMQIYANGILANSGQGLKEPLPELQNIYLGGGVYNEYIYNGQIAELQVWNVALSAAEVLAHFQGQSILLSRPYINQALAALSRLLLLTEKLQLSSTEIDSVRTFPECYDDFPAAHFQDMTLDNVRTLSTFKQLTQEFRDTQDRFIHYFSLFSTPLTTPLKLVNVNSVDKVLNADQSTELIIQSIWSGQTSEQWQLVSVGSGYVKLVNSESGKVLDAPIGMGAQLRQSLYDGGTNQQWQFNDTGNGFYTIMCRNGSSQKLVVDVDNASREDNAKVIQWEQLKDYPSQQWQLVALSSIPPISNDPVVELAAITGWKAEEVREISDHLPLVLLPSVSAIALLKKAFDLSTKLEANFAFHEQILPLATTPATNNWNIYTAAANATLNLAKASYNDDDWIKVNNSIGGTLNELTRNALAGFVQWKLGLPDLRRLSEYLLIDVEMSGTASISLIKQGILSAQMYLQRCRMNLEPGIHSVSIPAIWWEWLLSFGIWQANRKVFLYPENYLDPTLRKNKTELFQAFETELLQTEITEATVEAAYRQYLDGFAQLAQLQIIESYRCSIPQADNPKPVDTLFLFGRTVGSPATFYYRTCVSPTLAQPIWTPWIKIDLTIRANDLAPVFAFNKLFLFWNELQTITTTTNVDGTKNTITKATIRYTFQTFSGTWAEPQTLIEDLPIDYEPTTYTPLGIDLVEGDLLWQKPYALTLTGQNGTPDRILVFAGQILPLPSTTPLVPPSTQDPALTQFNQQLYQQLLQGYAASNSIPMGGYMALFPAITLSSDLLTASQFLILPTDASAPGTVQPTIGSLYGSALVMNTINPVIRANYLADVELSALRNGLIGYWPLDEGTGSTLYDRVSSQNGTIHTPNTTNWPVVSDFPGSPTRAVLQFGTKGNYATLPPTSLPVGNEITISVWINGGDPISTSIFNAKELDSSWLVLNVHLPWGTKIVSFDCTYAASNNDNDRISWDVSSTWSSTYQGKWTHWTFTKNAGTGEMAIYVNGICKKSDFGKKGTLKAASTFYLGCTEDKQVTYPGKIAELHIWNRALSPEEILLVAHSSSPLLENGTGQNSAVQTVKNQPDWSTFTGGGEAFLVLPPADTFQPISQSIKQTNQSGSLTVSFLNTSYGPAPMQFLFTRLTTSTIRQLSQKLLIGGIDHLLTVDSQLTPEPDFSRFQPTSSVIVPAQSTLDFHGPYGLYFQEIFFYMPFLIADTLNSNQDFAEAQEWYQYIFNPTQPSPPPLLSYWPLSGPPLHDIGNLSATVVGTASWPVVNTFPVTPSRPVLQFPNQGSYATLPSASMSAGNEITVSFWTNWTTVIQTSPFFAVCKSNADFRTFVVHVPFFNNANLSDPANYHVIFDCGTGSAAGQYDRLEWNLGKDEWAKNYQGKWVHWTFTKNATTGWMNIYVNGQLKYSNSNKMKPFGRPDQIYLAHDPNGKTYDGLLAELCIWNIELSTAEVLTNYTSYTRPLDNYWRYLPFRGNTLETLTAILQNADAIAAYNNDPLDPDAIAQLRVGAYQKAIVMKYIDNLLSWGDALFTQDTWESITQATMLYLLAYDLLGPRPENVGPVAPPAPETFAQIKTQYPTDNIPQFLLAIEQQVGQSSSPPLAATPFNEINAYFCVGENQQFVAYWDRVEDRLYKIRHSQNIAGGARQLALFEPPLNVAELVRAAAAGTIPLNTLVGLTTNVPAYRFEVLLERAKNITSTLIQLGTTVLGALEKKDAEQFARLQASQQVILFRLMRTTKLQQISEAQAGLDAAQQSLLAAQHRNDYYQQLISGGWSATEKANMALTTAALIPMHYAQGLNAVAAIDFLFPNIFGLSNGGSSFGMSFGSMAAISDGVAAILNQSAALSAVVAQYERREQDWQLQLQMAQDDITIITQQIAAAQFAVNVASSELTLQDKSIEQASQIEDFLKRKFSNQELYQWMVNRLSVVYFQSFKVALAMALAAQKAYQYELNRDDTYIAFDYWDDTKQGLLAGEGLQLGLTQLEQAYLDRNVRRLEIEKTISLLQLSPQDFLDLKSTGKCTFQLDEKLFDYDFPGHYCRQIKSIALSIPAIVGPYQNIQATLTQTVNRTLIKPDTGGVQYLLNGSSVVPDTTVLRSNWRSNQEIALSRGVNDSGMFELNFRDERYLPFEGTGAVSEWELRLPKATNRFNFASLSDVIIQLSYTALDAGPVPFTAYVQDALKTYTGAYYLNFNQAFPAAWYTFLSTQTNTQSQQLTVCLPPEIVPPNLINVKLKKIFFQLDVADTVTSISGTFMKVQIGEAPSNSLQIPLQNNTITIPVELPIATNWTIEVDLKNNTPPQLLNKAGFLDPAVFQNIECILTYQGDINWDK
jgi:Tc toxin complex TcA C-terminal TcB-binding domain/Neuraminidase-like domain/Concanavalin A-like lectin/glucanases superfamily/Ricin-type beta-trefoil lectin domain-like/Salmonella virulence plasmid 28.1kDa A protein